MDTLTLSGRRFSALGSFILALPMLALPTMACGQETRAGVVTKLVGTATVARAALPQPAPLRFKDDVLLQDRITTGESSAVRLLLGGKATITARERSVLTITEIPGTATVRLASGRAAIAVVKDKMNPGEIVEIRTPNAVVAVRGTVVIAEVEPVIGGYRSTITILKGHVDVTRLDGAGRLTGPAVDVRMLERVIVTSAKPIGTPQKLTQENAESLAAEFSFVPQNGPAASMEALTEKVKEAAVDDAMRAVGMAPDPRTMSASSGAVASDAPSPVAPRDSGPEVLGTTTTNPTGNPTGAVPGATTAVGNTVTTATGAVGTAVTGATTAVTNTVTSTVNTVTTTVNTVTSTVPVVTNTVGTVVPTVTNTVSTVVPVVTNTVSTVVPTVTNTVSTVVPVVTNTVSTVVAPVVNMVTTPLTKVTSPAAPTVPSTGGLLSGLIK
jgi:hypothetical protein